RWATALAGGITRPFLTSTTTMPSSADSVNLPLHTFAPSPPAPSPQPLVPQTPFELRLRNGLAVHFVGTVGKPDRPRMRPYLGERKVVADAGGAVRLDRAVQHAQRHARHDDL